MIDKVFIFALLLMHVDGNIDGDRSKPVTCGRDFRKVGCFKRKSHMTDMLITDLDPTHKNFSTHVDWENYGSHLHSLACRCRKRAREHYKYFGIGFYGECWAGKDNSALEKLFKSKDDRGSCVNGNFESCVGSDIKECAGTEDNDYFYQILDGDCSVKEIGENQVELFKTSTSLQRNKLVTILPKIGKVYMVSLEVKPSGYINQWQNVLQMTAAGNKRIYGYRIPGIWFHPWKSSVEKNGKLHICNAISGKESYCYNSEKIFPLNEWINIKINQAKKGSDYIYTIEINNKEVMRVKNTEPRTFYGVEVFVSNPWFYSQSGFIKNLRISEGCFDQPTNAPHSLSLKSERIIEKNKQIGEIYEFCKDYTVSFEVKPTRFQKKWSSILHMSIGGNTLLYGDRTPGIWFYPSTPSARSNRLFICAPINNKPSFCYKSEYFELNKWIRIKISQHKEKSKYIYEIFIDDRKVKSLFNEKPAVFYNVKAYAGDPWYEAQAGYIRNLDIDGHCEKEPSTFLLTQTPILRNSLLTSIRTLGKEYVIRFNILPTCFGVGAWTNALHFTLGANHGRHGDRVPGVFFSPSKVGAKYNKMWICGPVSNFHNYCYSKENVEHNKWIAIEIQQKRENSVYRYRIFLNGKKVRDVVNTRPMQFKNIKVYISDPWHEAQQGFIKDLSISGAIFN